MADQQSVTRKLAAILYADVAGYSRLTGADEEGTHRTVAAYLDAISGLVEGQGGRVVHYAGDAVLAEFPSVVAAIKCAVDVQKGLAVRNADVSDDRIVQFRIGVNLGDVIVDRDDIYGNGVNVAARLEALAEPGGICISGKVLDEVQGKVAVGFEDMGPQQVKNIAKPVQAYRVVLEKPSAVVQPPPLPEKPSIAVLPFTNLSGDPEQDFFGDGLAEDIITELSRFRSLSVIARNSSFIYKGRAVDVKTVARDLGVRYVLEGSVRKSGRRIRVTGQLIDAETDSHIWAERYDHDLDDLFAIQDEITRTIIGAIEPALVSAEKKRVLQKSPDHLNAWDLYQWGLWHLVDDVGRDALTKAKQMFAQACKLDASFAAAHAHLSHTHVAEIIRGLADDPEASLDKAAEAAERAVALDPRLPTGRLALGRVLIFRHAYERAIAEMEAAIELNPRSSRGYYGLGQALMFAGRPKESIPQFGKAIQLSPRGNLVWACWMMLGLAYVNLAQYEEAATSFEKAIEQPTAPFLAFAYAAATLSHLGRIDEAHAMIAEAKTRKPGFSLETVRSTARLLGPHSGADRITDGLRMAGLLE